MREVLLDPEYVPCAADLTRFLHLAPGSEEEADFLVLLEKAAAAAKPRAACRAATVEETGEGIVAAGMRLGAGLPTDRLKAGDEVYVFVATCGGEVEAAAEGLDVLERFWFDAIMHEALMAAEAEARKTVARCCDHTHFATIGPGNMPGWPIEGQKELFAFMAKEAEWCGIRLDKNYVMHPQKSTSGLFFPVNENWHKCTLCARRDCRERTEASMP